MNKRNKKILASFVCHEENYKIPYFPALQCQGFETLVYSQLKVDRLIHHHRLIYRLIHRDRLIDRDDLARQNSPDEIQQGLEI